MGDLPFPFNSTTYHPSGNGKWGINYIRRSTEIIFSGSDARLIRQVCNAGICRDWSVSDGVASVIAGVAGLNCKNQTLTFRLVDVNNNPLPSGTVVTGIDAKKITTQTFVPDKVRVTNARGGTLHSVIVQSEDACSAGSFSVQVTTPKGIQSLFEFTSN